jgi:hypothetical protein
MMGRKDYGGGEKLRVTKQSKLNSGRGGGGGRGGGRR